jgi:hypothetical protein
MTKRTILFIAAILIISLAAAVYLSKKTIVQKISEPAVEQEKKAWEQKKQTLEQEIATLKDEINKEQPALSPDKLREAFGETPQVPQLQKESPCADLKMQGLQFFSYLDQKGYFKAQGIEKSAYEQFTDITGKLESSRPLISGETQDTYMLMRNIAYFYRVLGDKNSKAIISILSKEQDIIEPTIKIFYAWINPWSNCSIRDGVHLSPEAFYDYASFFLNTVSGHSYLARRNLKMRTLVVYYCVLIVDKANEQHLNKYGIDIRPYIDASHNDIESQRGLAYKNDYLQTLDGLKKKYEQPPAFR